MKGKPLCPFPPSLPNPTVCVSSPRVDCQFGFSLLLRVPWGRSKPKYTHSPPRDCSRAPAAIIQSQSCSLALLEFPVRRVQTDRQDRTGQDRTMTGAPLRTAASEVPHPPSILPPCPRSVPPQSSLFIFLCLPPAQATSFLLHTTRVVGRERRLSRSCGFSLARPQTCI